MVLINLDRCLIDCGGESIARMIPPFTQEGGEIYDGNDNQILVREGVREMLGQLFKAGITLAVFGETDRPDIARWVMHHLNLESCFTHFGLNHDGRQDQISRVRRKAQMEIDDLLVIDNLHGGGPEWCEASGVVCYAIPGHGGLTSQHFEAALDLYRINAP